MSDTERSPYWDEESLPALPKLDREIEADVLVVGGGMTGLMTAYFLAEAGRSVVVLDRGSCTHGDTGCTSAHLTMVTDHRLHELASTFGQDHAQAVWDAGFAAIREIERIADVHGIDARFEWVDGFLHLPIGGGDDEEGRDELRREAALAEQFGFDAEFLESAPIFKTPAVRFGSQARFHPRLFLRGLLQALGEMGVLVFEQSEVGEFNDEPRSVTANGHRVTFQDVVLATHNPLLGLSGILTGTLAQTKLALYTSYVVAGRVPKGTVEDALWWDTADPYSYLRVEPHDDFDVVIYGGEDHKTGQEDHTERCYAALTDRVRRIFPSIEVTHRWSGQVIETPDGLPYIGAAEPHQYIATGFVGNGLTFGTLAAMIIADTIGGRRSPWSELFAPDRKALGRSLWDYVRENRDYPYYMIRDRLFGKEERLVRSIRRGQGAIISYHGERVAVSRDQRGRVTMRSAVCTHMGCLVRWNGAERSWDCPCHGSRFRPDGAVISGPAESPLSEIEPKG